MAGVVAGRPNLSPVKGERRHSIRMSNDRNLYNQFYCVFSNIYKNIYQILNCFTQKLPSPGGLWSVTGHSEARSETPGGGMIPTISIIFKSIS
jgi:hypothetical protein